jgi:hypothetical protein
MKRLFTLLLLAFIGQLAIAQDNRVALRLNYFVSTKTKSVRNDSLAASVGKLTYLLPAVGYYHTFKNNLGVGAEFGYRNSTSKNEQYDNAPNSNYNSYSKSDYKQQSYYFSLAVYETIKMKNYIANLSFMVPIEYATEGELNSNSRTVDKVNPAINSITITRTTIPKSIQYGFFLQAALYRKLYKGLHLGAEVSIGPSFLRQIGNSVDYVEEYSNSKLVRANATTNSHNGNGNAQLSLRPTISLQYIFGK